ncbi:MAG: tRNA (N(6)-L-threonylcarbamoyladenosine(37)-C(2))-methylthiotransferase MtaB [Chloroflexi bacterium]|jgi:threonylcarbamoyladenosine tRNA methylthiotransferase MtaB|nr:tRNA (N(6)-L-threonylcarbamoyladenosine(37)-C(2))-methylthiotransferase MtaB [Chloroflexota bacterium]MBT7080350.1 tRNA (N(6)-L-threonylcarbamoyladenosine(37)-C(2))-methylthiotransferase MtaB [Chloroflexota bacterium]MBT7290361.1 tRNA (N(6)-L-threonylcarbamoyladenosine(37)-C(2))-methylthiotransferase MtaB [Chloroflexota bacterium]
MKTASIAIQTLGCKLNQAESESLARQFTQAGYVIVSPNQNADVYILNTCTVTHIADRKARHFLRLAHRRNPDALVIAIGCYAQNDAETIGDIDGVSMVINNHQEQNLVDVVAQAGYLPCDNNLASGRFRTRAMLKIQSGCTQNCTYCIVPQVRGSEQSVPASQVLSEIKKLINSGFREIVLTGTHVGAHENIVELIDKIVKTNISRLRLSSLKINDITPSLLELWRDERICRHIHLPLQSGSNTVLKRMGRGYTTADFEDAVTIARKAIPSLSVTTDIIVGFPGETDAEFRQSYDFCQRMEFADIHVFPYSPRPYTVAAQMPDKTSPQVKKKRSNQMLELAKELSYNFRNKFIGQTMLVLWESVNGTYTEGFTDNYIKIYTKSLTNITNQIQEAKLTKHYKNGLIGELVNSE